MMLRICIGSGYFSDLKFHKIYFIFFTAKELRVGIGVSIGTFLFIVVFLSIGFADVWQKARQEAENARLLEEEKSRGRRRGKPAPVAVPAQQATNQNNSNVNLELCDEIAEDKM